ncbi:deleted in malignant brain tumors 1 protein-like isoform X24 [Ctenopharyngodon idella]|uniref:deleted in malignant brain tumors 1 protein-like isoform X23 n=1 Tax=Ctenopharyngodon idella TaxID=7959 RepID=UPI002232ADBD|nr:deleted in malignant brain tumors 1 protein-like isoform X23 [Ctenopharyngodon idella]XP_051722932.1 deleted in malignant brain tumors 1 protein-like isoform X24 [Ctenopharyngodon idella]
MEALNFLLCLLLTAYQANTIGSWTTGDWLYTTEVPSEPCGDYLTDWMGEFFSPRYPNSYPDNARCTWTIHSTGGTTVLLTFTDVYLETCCDYIRVYDGPSTLYPLLDEIRDYKNKRYNSSNNDLTVLFYSDGSISRRGFHANWVFVDSNSCRHNCGRSLGSCSCNDSCQDNRNCCYDYDSYCSETTIETTTAATTTFWIETTAPSCRYNCGHDFYRCSCTYDCQYYGNCCPDYDSYCFMTTTQPPETTTEFIIVDEGSCKNNCGVLLPICGCDDLCQNYNDCCPDYDNYCLITTERPTTTEFPSCMNNCGHNLGRCSCNYNCHNYGICCPDYDSYCLETTTETTTTETTTTETTTATTYWIDTTAPSCMYNCGHDFGSCSCTYDCHNYGNCCPDYDNYCFITTEQSTTTAPSCRYSCGYDLGSCSCSHDCQYYGNNCCPDYESFCIATIHPPDDPTAPSCMYNCGYHLGYCSCSRACLFFGDCCHDYQNVCLRTTTPTTRTTTTKSAGLNIEPARENINANNTRMGRFNASIAFYTSSSFYQQIYDSPYEVNLNQLLYVQVKLNRPDNSLDLFLDTCVASPNPSDFKDRSFDLLRNGCPRDNTYYSYTSGQHYYAQFSFRAFKVLRTHAYVYLQCKVIICPDNDYNSRCRQGCRFRRKRSLDSTYHTNTVTLGPIKLKGGRRTFKAA